MGHALAQDDCPAYDLRSAALGPTQDQGRDTGWCYGVAASDLLSNLLQERISPMATSVSYVQHMSAFTRFSRALTDDSSVDGGDIATALKRAASDGVCAEKNAAQNPDPAHDDFLYIDQIHSALIDGPVSESMICHQRENPLRLSIDQQAISKSEKGFEKMISLVNQAFSQGRIVGIEFNAEILKTESASRKQNHSSTLVAQKRASDGSCQYLIRSTGGLYCEESRLVCSEGNYWISRQELHRVLISTVTVGLQK